MATELLVVFFLPQQPRNIGELGTHSEVAFEWGQDSNAGKGHAHSCHRFDQVFVLLISVLYI